MSGPEFVEIGLTLCLKTALIANPRLKAVIRKV